MDENSCENETSESADGQKEKETENAPQLETVGITLHFGQKERNQVSDRSGLSFDASVSGPSTVYFPLVDNNQEETPLVTTLKIVSTAATEETQFERTEGAQSLEQNEKGWTQNETSVTQSGQNEKEPTRIELLPAKREIRFEQNDGQSIQIDLSLAESEPSFGRSEREPSQNDLSVAESTQGPEESSYTTEEKTQFLETPSAPPEEDEGSGSVVDNTDVPLYEEGAEMQPRVRLAPNVEKQLATRRVSVGPPPSYSFVMKQKKKLKPVPSLDPVVIGTTPPPSYAGTRATYPPPEERVCNFHGSTIYSDSWRGYHTNRIEIEGFLHPTVNHIYNFADIQTIETMWDSVKRRTRGTGGQGDIIWNSISFADPIWRSHSQPAMCTRCGIIVLTTTHTHDSVATHVAALALCLFGCWPCCLLPYCMNVCKNTYHHCPICQTYLGLYRPW